MSNPRFGRLLTAMVTPFDENRDLDLERVQEFATRLLDGGSDALVVCGICTRQARPRLQELYLQMARPCLVLCIGACACTGGIFRPCYHFAGPVDKVIREVDPEAIIAYVPGCPPKPEAIIAGAVRALGALPD